MREVNFQIYLHQKIKIQSFEDRGVLPDNYRIELKGQKRVKCI